VSGPVHVSFEIQDSATGKRSSSRTCRKIQIFDQCVLLVGEDGKSGSIIPISKLNELNWTKEQKSERR
jgi:hypothetical protein